MQVTITYNGTVLTQAGFRGVTMKALAEKISEKRARVTEIISIDGEEVNFGMSRTGSKRQTYNGISAAKREIGKIKNLSSCEEIKENE